MEALVERVREAAAKGAPLRIRGGGTKHFLGLPVAGEPLPLPGEVLVDWGGAQRWLFSDAEPAVILALAREAGGSARPWRNGPQLEPESPLLPLHRRLKESFDPAGILNPGLMHPEL